LEPIEPADVAAGDVGDNATSLFLTKGDNNAVDDRGLYSASQKWINKEHVIGRAKGYLPYIGMVTIIMNDYPIVKYILVGLMGLFVLTTKE
jgi:signal peptidase